MGKLTLNWEKLGLVIRPNPELWWWKSHAMVPVPELLDNGICRIYFSGRDSDNRSHIGWALLDLERPDALIETSREPILAPGDLGCFDDNGVTPSSIVTTGSRKNLYYIGWNPGSTVRVHLFGGLAQSNDNGATFARQSRAPILERTAVDPFLNTAPYALLDEGKWRMYYVSGVGWIHRDSPRYNIKYATSDDGIHWDRRGHVCIDFAVPEETALARPWVIKEKDRYLMWYSYKRDSYRIGYAESPDGLNWNRDDSRAGISVSGSGWDSQMVEYAAVVKYRERRYMFYNGNNYGQEGIGMAVEK